VTEPQHMAPLAAFHGQRPPAPAWFEAALAHEPERTFVEVEGAKVEVLAWGKRGLPGLMFLHGGAAHADWWSFIAPFFAATRRVVASSFTGMGRSRQPERRAAPRARSRPGRPSSSAIRSAAGRRWGWRATSATRFSAG